MPALVVAIVVIGAFVYFASMMLLCMKPACPECGKRDGVVARRRARAKKSDPSEFTCESCNRHFRVTEGANFPRIAKFYLAGLLACLTVLAVNYIKNQVEVTATLSRLRTHEDRPSEAYGTFLSESTKINAPYQKVMDFLSAHRNGRLLDTGTDRRIDIQYYWGFLPSSRWACYFSENGKLTRRVSSTFWSITGWPPDEETDEEGDAADTPAGGGAETQPAATQPAADDRAH